jgi:hypothetical protein
MIHCSTTVIPNYIEPTPRRLGLCFNLGFIFFSFFGACFLFEEYKVIFGTLSFIFLLTSLILFFISKYGNDYLFIYDSDQDGYYVHILCFILVPCLFILLLGFIISFIFNEKKNYSLILLYILLEIGFFALFLLISPSMKSSLEKVFIYSTICVFLLLFIISIYMCRYLLFDIKYFYSGESYKIKNFSK